MAYGSGFAPLPLFLKNYGRQILNLVTRVRFPVPLPNPPHSDFIQCSCVFRGFLPAVFLVSLVPPRLPRALQKWTVSGQYEMALAESRRANPGPMVRNLDSSRRAVISLTHHVSQRSFGSSADSIRHLFSRTLNLACAVGPGDKPANRRREG